MKVAVNRVDSLVKQSVKVVIKRLFVLLMASGFLWAAQAQAKLAVDNPLDRIVAVVNDEVITSLELDAEMTQIKKQLRQQSGRLPDDAVIRKQLLERMIMREIQLQMAKRGSIRVDDETLNRTVDNIAAQNHMDLSQLRAAIQSEGMDFETFRENMRNEIIIDRLQQREVKNRIVVTEQEIDNYLSNQKLQGGKKDEEYHIGHILIAVPEAASAEQIRVAREKAEGIVSKLRADADFRQTAIANSDGQQALEGGDLGWRRAEALPTLFADWVVKQKANSISGALRSPSGFHIIKLLGVRDNKPQHVITETHARHILIRPYDASEEEESRQRLEKIRQRIIAGEDFATLAKAHSEDPGSGSLGGDLGWVAPGVMVPGFEKAMDALKVGELSEPIRSRFGWHLIEVLERRKEDITEKVQRKNARDVILARKIDPAMQAWIRRIRDEAFVETRL